MDEPREPRKISADIDHPAYLEYDREIRIELWHNKHQTSSLRISRTEAEALYQSLTDLLGK